MAKSMKRFEKDKIPIEQIDRAIWEIPKKHRKKMRVPVRIVGTEKLVRAIESSALNQIINVSSLPGIVEFAWMMPDTHVGYGMPVGGVAAFDPKNGGVISPGAIGFDINCGMRLISTNLMLKEVKPYLKHLINELFKAVPAGVGRDGFLTLTPQQLNEIMIEGAHWMINKGFGWDEDKKHMEEHGKIAGADPSCVSNRALRRGVSQIATLGAGNHYLEIQQVDKIFNPKIAKKMLIYEKEQIVVMIHSGSRGFGHQNCSDYLRKFERKMPEYGIQLTDKQLACLPYNSSLGQDYYKAMAASVNFAFANRQGITHQVRCVFEQVFKRRAKEDLSMYLVYDVAHNTAKLEHGLIVHRKGATRSFGPNEPELPDVYQNIGQPVIIGGSMETGSYLLVGTTKAKKLTFGSTAHGSGRTMSRTKAKKIMHGKKLAEKMQKEGIFVKSASWSGLAEEGGYAYKDINLVVKSVDIAGISKPVASFKPLGNIKG